MKEGSVRFRYPERVKEMLLAAGGLCLGDGTTVSPEEIWEFMTVIGPRRFPGIFTQDRFSGGFSPDVDFITGIKRHYWFMTGSDRFQQRQQSGCPVVAVQMGSPREIYSAAHCLPVRPGFPADWLLSQGEGFEREEMQQRLTAVRNDCKKSMPAECCALVAPFHAVHKIKAPVSFLAPITMLGCSDAVFAMESARRNERNIPSFVVDFPVQHEAGEWRVQYLAEQLRLLAEKLGKLSGAEVTAIRLREEIQKQIHLRKLAREYNELWWSAATPPTNSGDRMIMGSADWSEYPTIMQLLQEGKSEIERRIADGVLGKGLQRDPLRIFVCGSCAGLNAFMVEKAGGVIVGHEQSLSSLYTDIGETSDPFMDLARSACSLPYERPPEARAAWTAEMVRRSRADGVVFMYNWGCNYQSAISRMVSEVIKEKAGVPTMTLDLIPSGRMASAEQLRTRLEAFLEILAYSRNKSVRVS